MGCRKATYCRPPIRSCSCVLSPSDADQPNLGRRVLTRNSGQHIRFRNPTDQAPDCTGRIRLRPIPGQASARRERRAAARDWGTRPIFRQQLNKVKAHCRAAKNLAPEETAKFPGKNDIFTLRDPLAQRLPKRSIASNAARPSQPGFFVTQTFARRHWNGRPESGAGRASA